MIVNWKCEDPDDSNKQIVLERVELLEVLYNKVNDRTLCRVLTIDDERKEYKIWVDDIELKDIK